MEKGHRSNWFDFMVVLIETCLTGANEELPDTPISQSCHENAISTLKNFKDAPFVNLKIDHDGYETCVE